MGVVGYMLLNAATRGPRKRVMPRARRYGPFALLCAAAPLILADVCRHLLQDTGVWPGCGHGPAFSRANSTDPFPAACRWSSSQYACSVPCCVPTWLPAGNGSGNGLGYAWHPNTRTYFPDAPAGSAPQFGTLRPDDSVYLPPSFDRAAASQPFPVFTAPLVLYGDGSRAEAPRAGRGPDGSHECPFGRNPVTGFCLLADPAQPAEAQLAHIAALAAAAPGAPSDPGPPSCDCDSCTHVEGISHLSPVGWAFTIGCTYAGFACLAAAVLWNADVVGKCGHVRAEWRALRGVDGAAGV
mmetsp:Transcript_2823/g.9236  ORF Transcript_2823/g.9236 Transcript_2823/m.9236 type:complete len:297 (-) Transcript_2823:429-1319(-)